MRYAMPNVSPPPPWEKRDIRGGYVSAAGERFLFLSPYKIKISSQRAEEIYADWLRRGKPRAFIDVFLFVLNYHNPEAPQ